MSKQQVLMDFDKLLNENLGQKDVVDINIFLTQIYSALDSIKFDVYSQQVTSHGKVDLLKSLITNFTVKVLHILYLPLDTFAQQVKCKPDKVRRKLNSGELSGIKLRNKWYVRKS